MHLTKEAIATTERIRRLNLINSVTGIKPANLIGTISENGESNLAIFSSVVHLGSNPALLGFIVRPDREAGQHTYDNIRKTGFYTINHVQESFIEQAHYTSAKFKRDESEFEKCQFTEEYLPDFIAPFVKESRLKLGMKLRQLIPIELNNTVLVIGEIEHLIVPDEAVDQEGHLDLSRISDVGISGLNSYYKLEKIAQFPYARPKDLPDFSGENN
ncbi:flavin reductase family protein [Larkinella terrae]|uniref:Flavin oxidoreductase n=1 Tax=Larkinella terrae TaxID=2025311 RepID=A0A7K0EEE6_9BACT|nr:flavin reductase [Larkinella terrae]MRS60072.1 flavin oxidoreductase [Larkinella terrae]